jgi:PAP2 superfamily
VRTPEQRQIAFFWANDLDGTYKPPSQLFRLTQKDAVWEPLSVDRAGKHFSPPFPAYVSGHATFGAAHTGIMRNFFGTDNVSFELDTDEPSAVGIKRSFNSFSSAALENGRSRIYLGVHFQWDADHGYISGTNLADYVFANRLQAL